MSFRLLPQILGSILCHALLALTTAAAEPAAHVSLQIELNRLEPTDQGCRVTLVLQNRLAVSIEELGVEVVLFDQDHQVNRLVTLNVGGLPEGKTRVKRFHLKGTSCSDIKRILLNDVTQCKGGDLAPSTCLDKLKLSSRTGVSFGL